MSGRIERVVIPLDAASENRTAIDTAARLAKRAKAPLHGIFIEDEDLLRLAGMPFAREFTPGAGAERLTPGYVESQWRAAAAHARADLAAAAKAFDLKWSFAVVRCGLEDALAAAAKHDLIVAGVNTRPIAGGFRIASRWIGSAGAAPAPLLLSRRAWGTNGTVVILLRDCGAVSARLVEMAAEIAAARDAALHVICPSCLADFAGFEAWVTERLAEFAVRVHIEMAEEAAALSDLHRRIAALNCRLLAIGGDDADQAEERLREFVENSACDLLVVP